MKTSELSGAALNWAVAKCENRNFKLIESFLDYYDEGEMRYSTDWAQGGPIIEREEINLRMHTGTDKQFAAFVWVNHAPAHRKQGNTPLIAAMRCYVASKLGDEVEIPEELS